MQDETDAARPPSNVSGLGGSEMERLRLSRPVVGVSVAVAMLAGCGGASTVSVPSAMTPTVARHATSSYGDLLYVSTNKKIVMVSYPSGTVVGTISWYTSNPTYSICSDPNTGNVFIPEGNLIYEYAHGATTPTATLNVPSDDSEARGCAIDPTTGNLALVATIGSAESAGFLVYAGAQGTPTTYTNKQKVGDLIYAAYDWSGDLFSMEACHCQALIKLAEMKAGKTQLNFLKLENCLGCSYSKMQWDGQYLAFPDFGNGGHERLMGQLQLTRTKANLVNTISLNDMDDNGAFWIYDGNILTVLQNLKLHHSEGIGVWPYPAGGNPTMKFYDFTHGANESIYDLTISVAPTRNRSR